MSPSKVRVRLGDLEIECVPCVLESVRFDPGELPDTAAGEDLDRLAELFSDSVQRAPGETDAELRERVIRGFDEQHAAAKRAYIEAAMLHPVNAAAPRLYAGEPIDDPHAPVCEGKLGCGTCPGCRRYKGER